MPLKNTNRYASFAMVSAYSPPDGDLLKDSSNTLWSCQHRGEAGLVIVPVQHILSVVAMIPHPPYNDRDLQERFGEREYVVEKMGLDIINMVGVGEELDNGE